MRKFLFSLLSLLPCLVLGQRELPIYHGRLDSSLDAHTNSITNLNSVVFADSD